MPANEPARLLDCPRCGYRISRAERDQMRIDPPCPRCGMFSLSAFDEVPNARPS